MKLFHKFYELLYHNLYQIIISIIFSVEIEISVRILFIGVRLLHTHTKKYIIYFYLHQKQKILIGLYVCIVSVAIMKIFFFFFLDFYAFFLVLSNWELAQNHIHIMGLPRNICLVFRLYWTFFLCELKKKTLIESHNFFPQEYRRSMAMLEYIRNSQNGTATFGGYENRHRWAINPNFFAFSVWKERDLIFFEKKIQFRKKCYDS